VRVNKSRSLPLQPTALKLSLFLFSTPLYLCLSLSTPLSLLRPQQCENPLLLLTAFYSQSSHYTAEKDTTDLSRALPCSPPLDSSNNSVKTKSSRFLLCFATRDDRLFLCISLCVCVCVCLLLILLILRAVVVLLLLLVFHELLSLKIPSAASPPSRKSGSLSSLPLLHFLHFERLVSLREELLQACVLPRFPSSRVLSQFMSIAQTNRT
jgi:hypothetical protein